MRHIIRFVIHVVGSGLALYFAERLITGFSFTGTILELSFAALLLTILHTFVLPVVKFVFGPLILLTLGLFTIVLNALGLYLLDIFIQPLTISGYVSLLLATLLISIINIVAHFVSRILTRE